MRIRRIVIRGLSSSTIFFQLIAPTARFSKTSHWTLNVCFQFLYNFCLKHFSFYEVLCKTWSKMYIGIHVECPLLSDFNENWIFSTDFRKKYSNIIFHENPSSGSRVVPCERA